MARGYDSSMWKEHFSVAGYRQPKALAEMPRSKNNGRFVPIVLRDSQGRRLVEVDMREVERRLKARTTEDSQ